MTSAGCGPTHDSSTSSQDDRYLDQDDFRRHYADPKNPRRMTFYVENVHCTSCLWRIENLQREMTDIAEIRLDMGRHMLDIEVTPHGSMARVGERLRSMGYPLHPLVYGSVRDEAQRRSHRNLLIRIGVAGAAAGNIMLLSTSLYSGAHASQWAGLFEWLTLILFLPILLYSAVPFYRNSWVALRARRASIDVPIVGAIVLGTGLGAYHLVVGSGDVYFDSLAVLVFLLLASRYFLLALQDRFLAPSHLRAFFETNRVRVRDRESGRVVERHIDRIRAGDDVVVRAGERLPVDGRLLSEEAYVNAAVLTGEAQPQRVLCNETVFAGTQLTSDEVDVRVEKVGAETRVGLLLRETERGVLCRTPLISLTDRAAQWFAASVLVLGIVFAVVYSFVNVHEAINRALALVILACPCALALATPLTQSLALKKAARGGSLIKKAEAFEKLNQVRTVFFDKTGTLTHGELELAGWWPSPPQGTEQDVIYALEKDSHHPIGRLLAARLSRGGAREIRLEARREIQGRGVEGTYEGVTYEMRALVDEREAARLGAPMTGGDTYAGFYRNGELVRVARFGDRTRASSRDVVSSLRAEGRRVYLLTGDGKGAATAVAAEVGIDPAHVFYSRSPEEKQCLLQTHMHSLMVGDGVNDSVALAYAHVSVAVQGSMETSFRAADIYLTQPGLRPLADLVELSRVTIAIIKRNLVFSLAYNATGATLALLGFINPLIAAVLMPLSSVTVVTLSVVGNRFWRRFGMKEQGRESEPGQVASANAVPATPDVRTLASRGGSA